LNWDQYCFSILWCGTFGKFCPKTSYISWNYTRINRFFQNFQFYCEKEKYRQKKKVIGTCQNWTESDFLSKFWFLQIWGIFPFFPKKLQVGYISKFLPTIRNPSCTSTNTFLVVRKKRNLGNWQFLLSFTQLSIWWNNFLNNDLAPMKFFGTFNATKQREPPCVNLWKNAFCDSCSKRILDSLIGSFSKAWSSCNKYPIVKFESFG
jgi:hypothetical protein